MRQDNESMARACITVAKLCYGLRNDIKRRLLWDPDVGGSPIVMTSQDYEYYLPHDAFDDLISNLHADERLKQIWEIGEQIPELELWLYNVPEWNRGLPRSLREEQNFDLLQHILGKVGDEAVRVAKEYLSSKADNEQKTNTDEKQKSRPTETVKDESPGATLNQNLTCIEKQTLLLIRLIELRCGIDINAASDKDLYANAKRLLDSPVDLPDELAGYKIGPFETFRKRLARVRSKLGTLKNSPRAGRTGRSMIQLTDFNPNELGINRILSPSSEFGSN